jgi:hypothetical protein
MESRLIFRGNPIRRKSVKEKRFVGEPVLMEDRRRRMNLRTIIFALTGTFLMVFLGYAATVNIPLEKIQGKGGANIYKNNFLGMQMTTPSSITTAVPVSSFERAPGDRMFFEADGHLRAINVIFYYGKFNMKSYAYNVFLGDYYQPCSETESMYYQIENESGREFLRKMPLDEPIRCKPGEDDVSNTFNFKVDFKSKKIGESNFFYYAVLNKKIGRKEYYFIYPLGKGFIEFAFFGQLEDLVLNIMKSVQFFAGDHEDPNYPYWPN